MAASRHLQNHQFFIVRPIIFGLPSAHHCAHPMMNQRKEQVYPKRNEDQYKRHPIPERLFLFSQFIRMPIVQINRKRITGPPLDYEGPTPPQEAQVFVRGLPRDATEEELLPLFTRVGRVYQLRLIMESVGDVTNRGFCFVKFFTIEEAASVIRDLDNWEIRPGHRIRVFRSQGNVFIQLKGIPRGVTTGAIFDMLTKLSGGVQRVTLVSKRIPTPAPLEFWTVSANVKYRTHWDAELALRLLLSRPLTINGFPISGGWAEPGVEDLH